MPTILVIEDEPQVRQLLCLLLRKQGHDIVEAEDGARGVLAARLRPVDLIFCDLFMPEQDGMETIPQLRREHPNVPVVAMSGGAYGGRMDLLPMAELLGTCWTLDKPFTGAEVLAAVKAALEGVAT